MRWLKRFLLYLILPSLVLYLVLGALVCLRAAYWAPPGHAADAFIKAIQSGDDAGIYLFSELLGAHLATLMQDSNMLEEQRQELLARDFARFKEDRRHGGPSLDAMRRERELLAPPAEVSPASPSEYRAEVQTGKEIGLITYYDLEGEAYHLYYRVSFASPEKAPKVSVLDNVRTGQDRKIKSLVIRLEVRRRPEAGWLRAWFLRWGWLDKVRFLYPFAGTIPEADPSRDWMVGVSFDIDKLTLETF